MVIAIAVATVIGGIGDSASPNLYTFDTLVTGMVIAGGKLVHLERLSNKARTQTDEKKTEIRLATPKG